MLPVVVLAGCFTLHHLCVDSEKRKERFGVLLWLVISVLCGVFLPCSFETDLSSQYVECLVSGIIAITPVSMSSTLERTGSGFWSILWKRHTLSAVL